MRTSVPPLVATSVQTTVLPGPQSAPAIGKLFVRFDDHDLAIDYPVPIAHGGGAKIELMANHRLEVIVHQPLLDQPAFCESTPDFFRRVRHLSFDHK
jgi:hypothetical protein